MPSKITENSYFSVGIVIVAVSGILAVYGGTLNATNLATTAQVSAAAAQAGVDKIEKSRDEATKLNNEFKQEVLTSLAEIKTELRLIRGRK